MHHEGTSGTACTFYVNIAKNIGIENDMPVNDKHPSIEKIKENVHVPSFEFSPVTEAQVNKCIKRLDHKKANGVDAIPPKIVKAAAPVLSRNIGKARIPTGDLVPKTRRCRNQHSMAFQIPTASLDAYKCRFFPQTIRDWNDLPDSLISSAEMSDDCVSKFSSLVRARD